jgi:RNA polymerase-binding transcription factor DksA
MKNLQDIVCQRLTTRRDKLHSRLVHVTRDSRHTEGLQPDSEEQATELENDEVLAKLDIAIRTELRQIDTALKRLNAGHYGICVSCNKPIDTTRLELLPYATRCLNCERAVDQ